MNIEKPFYDLVRHITPDGFKKWISRYTMEGAELQNLVQQNPQPIHVQNLLLSTAQNTALEIPVAGRAVAIFGYTTATQFNQNVNPVTGIETSVTTVFVDCRINEDLPERAFPLKHNRGYRGDFRRLYLRWPEQANNSARLVIFKFDEQPWIGGENAT